MDSWDAVPDSGAESEMPMLFPVEDMEAVVLIVRYSDAGDSKGSSTP